jgi:hypothetical protein
MEQSASASAMTLPQPALPTGTKPNVLYPHAQWYFLLAMAITWLGFSRTYFAVIRTEPFVHHIHGALMGGWIALLVIQPMLYQRGNLELHRLLGRAGVYVLVPAIVVCGFFMDRRMIRMQGMPPSAIDQFAFLDIGLLLLFPALVILSICYARNVQLHARYIVCTVLLLMPPSLTRALFFLPAIRSFEASVNISWMLVDLVLLVLIADDKRRGRIWAPYPLALGAFTFLAIVANYVKDWTWWHVVSGWIAGSA